MPQTQDQAFEAALLPCRGAVERFVHFKIANRADADDVLSETWLAAYRGYPSVADPGRFKAWLVGIARNKVNDYYRAKARRMELPLENIRQTALYQSRFGVTQHSAIAETLDALGDADKQILYLYFFRELPQQDIAARLHIPLGTVKSRLHAAKQRFAQSYPYPPKTKGESSMKKLPVIMPEYTIEKLDLPPFPVRWEEMMGWFVVPRLGEKCAWAMYDFPGRKRTEHTDMEVVGRAEVHGIEGVEIAATEYEPMDCNQTDNKTQANRRFIAQLTDTHCRILAESHEQDGVKKCYTFLDGDAFLDNWGFGEDNCGNEVSIAPKGDITRKGDQVTTVQKPSLMDVVGRYAVTIGGKRYDTLCVMDVETYNSGVASEQYIDQNGRTVLWRRFNKDDWALDSYGKPWTQQLSDNERITVNGQTYVHWYDCITDYIL